MQLDTVGEKGERKKNVRINIYELVTAAAAANPKESPARVSHNDDDDDQDRILCYLRNCNIVDN